jgi:GntR family transcriptional repressor for pyruvate dehydrogenase complex
MPSITNPISKATLADQVAERILTLVTDGTLVPGSSLPSQRDLAQQFRVSLAAVREAVQRLQSLGVIKTQHGSGMVVCDISWKQVMLEPSLVLVALEGNAMRHLWEARHALEIEVARLASLRATETDLAAIRGVLDEAGEFLETAAENQRLNRKFHLALAAAAKNPVIEDLLSGLLDMDFSAIRKFYTEASGRESWELHRNIFNAISSRDPHAAEQAMEAHAMALDEELSQLEAVTAWMDGQSPESSAIRHDGRPIDPDQPGSAVELALMWPLRPTQGGKRESK